jgi:hypothetical protein
MSKKLSKPNAEKPRCGLCGKTKNLTRTACCGSWICDDEHKYVMFSYARNSCNRNHDRYTLCASHFHEEHSGDWKTCKKCRGSFETEMYVWYGTNEYNFEILHNPPSYKPTSCSKCGRVIRLARDGYTRSGNEYWCEQCSEKEMAKQFRRRTT